MTRSKKIFVALAIVFVAFLVTASYDISRRTTFPGQPAVRHSSEAQLKDQRLIPDSTRKDSSKATRR